MIELDLHVPDEEGAKLEERVEREAPGGKQVEDTASCFNSLAGHVKMKQETECSEHVIRTEGIGTLERQRVCRR